MIEFQLYTLVLSTYLPNMLLRFAFLFHSVVFVVVVECMRIHLLIVVDDDDDSVLETYGIIVVIKVLMFYVIQFSIIVMYCRLRQSFHAQSMHVCRCNAR